MADAVVNHTSAQGTWFRGFLDGDPAYADFFARLPHGVDTVGGRAAAHLARWPTSSPPPTATSSGSGRRSPPIRSTSTWRNPRVLLAIVEVLLRYVGHGARAIRLDAIAFAWKDPATASINLPGAHAVVGVLRACLDEVAPGVVLVTETNVPHAENVAYFGTASMPEAHAVYQFALAAAASPTPR